MRELTETTGGWAPPAKKAVPARGGASSKEGSTRNKGATGQGGEEKGIMARRRLCPTAPRYPRRPAARRPYSACCMCRPCCSQAANALH
jgi:hypothetical protein